MWNLVIVAGLLFIGYLVERWTVAREAKCSRTEALRRLLGKPRR